MLGRRGLLFGSGRNLRILSSTALLTAAFLPGSAARAGGGLPSVTVNVPTAGQDVPGNTQFVIQYTATDDTGVASVDIYYRPSAGDPWVPVALGRPNTGLHLWYVHNTPSADARIRVVARDPFGNEGEGESADFDIIQETGATVLSTLRDYHQPGTQPLTAGAQLVTHSACQNCHGFYDPDNEPHQLFIGTMMHNSLRDPIFQASLVVAQQDATSSGDFCLRCHAPIGWLSGRSQPTDGSQMQPADRDGVNCHLCHRVVDPEYVEGVSPAEDADVLASVAEIPVDFGNGMYVIDTQDRRRGPFDDYTPPHPFLKSPHHREAEMCAPCHNVSSPLFERVSGADYAPNDMDEEASTFSPETLLPLERTFSEWLASEFVSGVFAPEFAGNKPDGIVSTCQDCHMSDALAQGCVFGDTPVREDMPRHDLTGGNTWVPTILDQVWPGEVDPVALADAAARAEIMLQKAAVLDVVTAAAGDSFSAAVTITNRSGHKLPSGYPEGRRMWVNVQAYDSGEQLVYESGAYDFATGVLTHDEDATVYEKKLGISPAFGAQIGKAPGPSFHFVLSDTVYKDNRIPPRGFSNVAFDAFGGKPVDPDQPGLRYPDQQYWDTPTYPLPPTTASVITTLYYQTISKEYIEFLRDENQTNDLGDDLYDLWTANGRAAPVVMARDTTEVSVVAVGDTPPGITHAALRTGANPFASRLLLHLELSGATDVLMEVFDVQGRRVNRVPVGRLGGGAHRLVWDGLDAGGNDSGAGVFYVRVTAGTKELVRRVVRLR